MPTRRDMMIGALAATVAAPAPAADGLAAIEATLGGGRLGFVAIDLAGPRRIAHRADERFAMCSTFKLPLAAATLAAIDAGRLDGDRRIAIRADDLLDHAPAVLAALPSGGMTIFALAQAAVELSDNAAANLLLARIGGPAGLTRFMRAHGGGPSRLDRTEPTLNTNLPGDRRDTTTPAAMAAMAEALLVRQGLTPMSRDRLLGWMEACGTGANRVRAGLPAGWRAGDKTGSGARGAVNDVAIAWPTDGPGPILFASYIDAPAASLSACEAAHALAARRAVAMLR